MEYLRCNLFNDSIQIWTLENWLFVSASYKNFQELRVELRWTNSNGICSFIQVWWRYVYQLHFILISSQWCIWLSVKPLYIEENDHISWSMDFRSFELSYIKWLYYLSSNLVHDTTLVKNQVWERWGLNVYYGSAHDKYLSYLCQLLPSKMLSFFVNYIFWIFYSLMVCIFDGHHSG